MKTKDTAAPSPPGRRSDGNRSALDVATRGEIRQRAYEIFRSRHGAPGNPVLDWLQAEQEIRAARKRAAR